MPTGSSVLSVESIQSFRLPDDGGTYLISYGINTPLGEASFYGGLEVKPAGYIIDTMNNTLHIHVGYWKIQ